MSLLISLLGGFIFSFTPWAIGQKILKRNTLADIALKASVGWLCIYFVCILLALFSSLNRPILLSLSLLAFLITLPIQLKGMKYLFLEINHTFKESTYLEKCLMFLILGLIVVRFFQSSVPTINWDSLNQHLPLLSSRLLQGNLDPIYTLPTDRRTPFSGVLLKLPIYCFTEDGRSISMLYFGIYIAILIQIWEFISSLHSRKAALFGVACYVSWIDVATYYRHLGDEVFFCLFSMAIMYGILQKVQSKLRVLLYFSILGLAFSIKLTTLFFCPILLCALLLRHFKPKKYATCSLGLGLFFIIGFTPYLKQFQDHHMIYPLQRWTNLLEFGPEAPSVFSFEEIKRKRAHLNLDQHRDNQKVSSHPINKWLTNLKKLIYLPLGPFLLWLALLVPFYFHKRQDNSFSKIKKIKPISLCFMIVFISLNLSMVAWSFSPQAMTRYLLPLWGILTIALACLIYEMSLKTEVTNWLYYSLLLLLSFTLALETKYAYLNLIKDPWQESQSYWLQYASDGPLIKTWKDINPTEPPTFYVGNSAYLLNRHDHRFAQIGNEVGWREPRLFLDYLKKSHLETFIYSEKASAVDSHYEYLKELAIEAGLLKLQKTHPLGEIYLIQH